MAQKIYLKDSDVGLGCFSLPVLTFNERNEILKTTNPQLNEQERAAVVYFGMLAEQPEPSGNLEAYYIEPENGPYKETELNYEQERWLEFEREMRYGALIGAMYRQSLEKADAITAYYKNLARLQNYIAYYGLGEGIQKTLMEQKRKLAGLRAGIEASKAAAAKALAMSQITDEMSDEAKFEAAQKQGEAQRQMDAAISKGNELERQLNNISNGLPADFGSESSGGSSGGGLLALLAAGAAAFFALKG